MGRLERVLLIRVVFPPLERYDLFQAASPLSILSINGSQMALNLYGQGQAWVGRRKPTNIAPQTKQLASSKK